jgi:hypothetical protein
MKIRLIVSCIFCVCALLSCSDNRKADTLYNIAESFMETAPDSSLAILNANQNKVEPFSKHDRMKFELLRAEAMNKAFIPMDTFSRMYNVADYYNSHGNKKEKGSMAIIHNFAIHRSEILQCQGTC